MILVHPLTQAPGSHALREALFPKRKPMPHEQTERSMSSRREDLVPTSSGRKSFGMDGFLDDLFDTAWDAVVGLNDALSSALTATINTIKQIGETIALVVRACIGDVKWSEVMDSLGEVFQGIGAVLYYINPIRATYIWLSESPLTAHAFNELDKFTGGMITTAVNLSDLPYRAMRGDPISTQELINDALLVITIVSIIFTGPVGVGILLGTMVGRQVCSKQTEARDACMVAFQIAGAAAGSWASAASGVTWGGASEAAARAAEEAAYRAGPEAYANYWAQVAQQEALAQTTSFLPHLTNATQTYLTSVGIDAVTAEAVELCQENNWVGDRECEILGRIAADYVKAPDSMEWDEFLVKEIAAIGAEELMLQWFPPDTPQYQAIERAWQIKYIDVPVDQTNIVQKRFDPKTLLLIAAGVATVMIGAS